MAICAAIIGFRAIEGLHGLTKIGNAILHSMSFSYMDFPQEVYDLALLFDMRTQEGPKKHVNFHSIGNVHL